MNSLWKNFKELNRLQKRGIIYIIIAMIMIVVELTLIASPRTVVLLLWGGVLGIGLMALTVFKGKQK